MPIVPGLFTIRPETGAITLARYATQVLHEAPENMFWGVRRDEDPMYSCRRYWCKWERDMVQDYLAEAQSEFESEAGIPIGVRWFASERVRYDWPLKARRGLVIEAGVRAEAVVQADAAVTHNADVNGRAVDSTVTVATTVTDVAEIVVRYPESLTVEGPVEIDPSDIDVGGGVATIRIPRWRLVHPDVAGTICGNDGLDYNDTANFLAIVDVYRVYNDPTTNATLVWPHQCSSSSGDCCLTCSEYTQAACIYLRDGRLGILDVAPAEYTGGEWRARTSSCCGEPQYALINYRAGMDYDDPRWRRAQDAIVRLAHTKMPEEACGCEVSQRLWRKDREEPEFLDTARQNCPFGTANGAWIAWRFTQTLKQFRHTTLT